MTKKHKDSFLDCAPFRLEEARTITKDTKKEMKQLNWILSEKTGRNVAFDEFGIEYGSVGKTMEGFYLAQCRNDKSGVVTVSQPTAVNWVEKRYREEL